MWQKLLYSILSGFILGQSFLSNGVHWLVFIGWVPLLIVEHSVTQSQTKKKGLKVFLYAYCAFLVWNAASYWWLHYSERPDGTYAWEAFLIPVIFNSFFMALVFWLYYWVKKESGNGYGLFFLPIVWICFEKLHLDWELTYPWLNLGNVFAWRYTWVQWYDYTGTFGGTLWVFLVNILVFYQLIAYKNTRNRKFLYRLIGGGVFLIAIPIALSLYRYQQYQNKGNELMVTVLQPALDPYKEKYQLSASQIVNELWLMIDSAKDNGAQYFVSPETAFPGQGSINLDDIENDDLLARLRSNLASAGDLKLVSGVELHRASETREGMDENAFHLEDQNIWLERYNSAIAIDGRKIMGLYHKSKLVPGVESFPYKSILEPVVGSVMLNFGGTVSSLSIQKNREVFSFPEDSLVVAPVICYESIYGEYVTEYMREGANVIFVMTNDSWWGVSEGHKQLMAYGRLRTIENRRSMARAANSGISCFIDQKGDVVDYLPYGEKGALVGSVQLNNQLTFYTKYGDVLARVALLLLGILLAYSLAGRLMKKRENI